MIQQVRAVFEHGRFVPVAPLYGIPEHSVVRITIEFCDITSKDQKLALLREIPVDPDFAEAIEMGRKQPWVV
ncbi:MAG TPA: hypothetical protein PLI09_12635 [Candidatus Hydrogenedentes bacterium]|nr:hypothetical protein [Candidatus Hydrogenedentota bacterium]